MKKVIKVSINKIPFTLSEEAYNTLKVYLDHLRRYYSGKEDGSEIVDSIEERIAELLSERTLAGEHVVSKDLVQEILDIMGPLEMIEEESGADHRDDPGGGNSYPPPPKRLYRDVDHKVLGGVCSGLAAYFNIDVVIVRLIYVVGLFLPSVIRLSRFTHGWGTFTISFGWFFFAVYLLMWILIPAALTVEEKYAMHGAPLSARGLQRVSREDRLRTSSRASRRSGASRRPARTTRPVSDTRRSYSSSRQPSYRSSGRNNGWYVVLRVLAVFVGLLFLISSSAVLISLVVAFSATGFALNLFPTALFDLVAFTGNVFWLKTCGILTIILPALGFLYLGSVLVFNIRGHKWIGITMFFTWLAALIGLVVTGTHGAANFRRHASVEERIPIELTSDTLFIDLDAREDFLFERYWIEADNAVYKLGWFEGKGKDPNVIVFPSLTVVRQSEQETPSILVRSGSFGRSEPEARHAAKTQNPVFELNGNVLSIPSWQINKTDPWNGNLSSLKLYVPADQVIIVRKPIYHEFGKSNARKISIKGFD